MKPWVYVAGPYTSPDPVRNTRRALGEATRLLDSGLVVPVVPHLTMFWHFLWPHAYEEWLDYDRELLSRCDAVLRLDGVSPGADGEVAFARERGLPVFAGKSPVSDVLAWARGAARDEVPV